MKPKHYELPVTGMQCAECENHIVAAVAGLPGIIKAQASFTDETLTLDLDSDIISLKTVCAAVKSAGYECSNRARHEPAGLGKRFFLIVIAITGIILLLQLDKFVQLDLAPEDIGKTANYGLLFLVGVLTSFHCIGMCGGFVLSYTVSDARSGKPGFFSHLLYGLGKTLSYSGFGALFGLIGGAITFTLGMRSMASAIAGVFLILYGLSMMEAFSGLRHLHIRLPFFVNRFLVRRRQRTSNPFIIGLLNGLMIACGPLQAMYIMAAGTGSALAGATMLAVFALGTLPIMLAFGYFAGMISSGATQRFMKISAFIILLLGAAMLNRSLLISGSGYDVNSLLSRASLAFQERFMTWRHDHADAGSHLQDGYQVIYMEAEATAYKPDQFNLRYGIPVKWIINVKELSSCNKSIIVPALDMTIDLKPGLQVVEFTPQQMGAISWSCYMGMIPGTFVVKK
ncbi:urease accessory protein UreH domain-containing protein [Methylobacter sp. YRD-M1]|uniref:urease accessory protein UreH domain-containing protein n=1 Tax=Methylobacter sp. YRD-M1 TaxID=2911520 RepID=UPI00227A7640|nr:sulfite exporter TauE/SafE family protein [Methylobacter sp. YRD-M1]WAK01906.1 sulfite exporter TauE/SafE family protein [Methylobacter sp. YRD-M1]